MSEVKNDLKNTALYIKWAISLLVLVPPLFLPLSFEVKAYVIITLWAIIIWMFELVSEAIIGILLPVLYILFKVATPSVAFSGWTSNTPWITIGGLIVGSVFVSSGLVKRIAYKLLTLTKGTFLGVVVGLTVTCIIITPIIPSVMAKVALMTPIAIGFCEVLDLEKKSKSASTLMLVVFLALWSPKMAFLTASADSVLAAGILSQHYEYTISWFGWAKDMFIPAILWTCVSVSLVYFLKPLKIKLEKSYVDEQYALLGPVSFREKKTIAMTIVLILLLATDSLHNIDSTWIMVIIGSLCFFPGLDLMKPGDFNKLSFSIVFFLVGAVSIGSVTTSLGITDSIVEFITPIFANQSSFTLVMAIYLFAIIANFTLNPLALIGTLMGPVADICATLGYPSILGGYAMIMGFNQGLFPYQIGPLMLLYGYGYLKMTHLLKVMAIRIGVGIIFTAIITYPYWKMMGLLG